MIGIRRHYSRSVFVRGETHEEMRTVRKRASQRRRPADIRRDLFESLYSPGAFPTSWTRSVNTSEKMQ